MTFDDREDYKRYWHDELRPESEAEKLLVNQIVRLSHEMASTPCTGPHMRAIKNALTTLKALRSLGKKTESPCDPSPSNVLQMPKRKSGTFRFTGERFQSRQESGQEKPDPIEMLLDAA